MFKQLLTSLVVHLVVIGMPWHSLKSQPYHQLKDSSLELMNHNSEPAENARILNQLSCNARRTNPGKILLYGRWALELVSFKMQSLREMKMTSGMEAKYPEEQISSLERERQLHQEKIRLLTLLVVMGALFLGVLAYQFYKSAQSRKIIAEKNIELEAYISDNLQLENFAYLASHDLRTPLRNIISFSQLIQQRLEHKLTTQELEFLDHVIMGTKEMSRLIDDLQTYSQIQRHRLQRQRIPIRPFITQLLEEFKQVNSFPNGQISYRINPEWISADPELLRRLLMNLLDNADKFRKPGVKALVNVSCRYSKNRGWVFEVSDNGIGFDPEYREKVFLIFKRLNRKADFPGSGIGLAICKKIVEQHGGSIHAKTRKDQGTTFIFNLPKDQGLSAQLTT